MRPWPAGETAGAAMPRTDNPPLISRVVPGAVVPIPTLPELMIVTLAASEGPIIVELAIAFVMPLPKAEAPLAVTVLLLPIAVALLITALLPSVLLCPKIAL